MTALEYMEKQAQKHCHDLERELERNAPEEVIGNIIKKISHYAMAADALKKVGVENATD